jgi:hypothetical protein
VKQALTIGVLLLATITSLAHSQSESSLPATLAGRWSWTGPGGNVTESFALTFEGPRTPGSVQGRFTWRGVTCGAKDEPIQAQWDGTILKFEAVLKSDINTQRSNGRCGPEPGRWELKRKSDGSFEGEGRVGNFVLTLVAGP